MKYAPVYMSVYDGPEYGPLGPLTLSNDEIGADAEAGDTIGTISGMADSSDSVLTLVDDGNGAVVLDGADLKVGSAELEVGTFDVIVRETNYYTTPPNVRDTTFTITVTA